MIDKLMRKQMTAILAVHIILLAYMAVVLFSGSPYLFLNWNLLLAIIPFDCALLTVWLYRQGYSRIWVGLAALVWLAFYPNTVYMLTDFIHLNDIGNAINSQMQVFNYSLLTGAIFFGVFLGLASSELILVELFPTIKHRWQIVLAALLSFLSAFGIFLGRYLRLNSWDIVSRPKILLGQMKDVVLNQTGFAVSFVLILGLTQLSLMAIYHYLKEN
ncbi:DUF1361 domain-containing protein [Weissella halotolerans]|uniref:DUF1361 domain-containing protein n=1 Tax=Weissella halotolerans DSM 20190 TaxID=1123500 RepID=A0A0R2FTQ7_9LACO|nr:DUF1361 domain-containing protein [Weissella halotolerans]KRN31664.1 hypothetical protein IV68_GL000917 [Weissella halotolerans DSM 20190]